MTFKTKIIFCYVGTLIFAIVAAIYAFINIYYQGSIFRSLTFIAVALFWVYLLLRLRATLIHHNKSLWRKQGLCRDCGYDWKVTKPKCPECGKGYT